MTVSLLPAIVQHSTEDFLQASIPCEPLWFLQPHQYHASNSPFSFVSPQLPKDHGMGVVYCRFLYSTCSQEELAQWFDLVQDPESSSAGQSPVLITPGLGVWSLLRPYTKSWTCWLILVDPFQLTISCAVWNRAERTGKQLLLTGVMTESLFPSSFFRRSTTK